MVLYGIKIHIHLWLYSIESIYTSLVSFPLQMSIITSIPWHSKAFRSSISAPYNPSRCCTSRNRRNDPEANVRTPSCIHIGIARTKLATD